MTLRRPRRALALVASFGLLFALSAAPGVPAVVAAANDGIDVRTTSTYTLVPKDRLVHVVVDVTARNTTPPTTSGNIITRYFFEELHFALQPEAAHARATQDGHSLATATDSRQGYIQLAITLRSKLNFDQTTRVRLTYDLPGGKPRSKSDIRVGAAFATFYAWVNGDRAGIRILLPDSFEPSQTGEAMVETHEGNKLVYSADGITDTAHWYAAINADRPSGLRSEALTIPTGEQVTVLAWPEDGEWLDRVADRLRRGLPQLDRLIGLPWPVTGSLVVTEVHTPLLEGYSGLFHPDTGGIEISEDLDDLTIVHEASHAWFNSSLFTGRWINEGLANTYGTKALKGLRIDSPPPFDYRPDRPGCLRSERLAAAGPDQRRGDRGPRGLRLSDLVPGRRCDRGPGRGRRHAQGLRRGRRPGDRLRRGATRRAPSRASPTGGPCWTISRSEPSRPTPRASSGRMLSVRPTCACSTRGRRLARRTARSSRTGRAGCRPSPFAHRWPTGTSPPRPNGWPRARRSST